FRELSVVIIGIFITLFITDRMNNFSKQREIRESVYFIRMELANNLSQLKDVQEMYLKDMEILRLLRGNMEDVRVIPMDFLEAHANTLG
ncbi:MAG: hypothetical protein LIP01_07545, partial [Tannerellaceae bacterium]|nr:hypothetical protein [Tannerellaceae bacterium]